ncbi:hypothetical protein [Sulfurihydrogenibium sp.]|uniref:hypothetical protein n=1 Tax=Sulfurihydrogenibium sp. TaxID=2053621 RepID=UPI00262DB3CE|nr:hypothetical protein [Sulfurihydrogenibium sp.]
MNFQEDKKGRFRPQILSNHYKRVNEDYIDLLISLVYNGYSESKIDFTLKSLGLERYSCLIKSFDPDTKL